MTQSYCSLSVFGHLHVTSFCLPHVARGLRAASIKAVGGCGLLQRTNIEFTFKLPKLTVIISGCRQKLN